MADFRVGIGTDIHRLEAGHQLVLGGVQIPFDKGFVAHSDGDVLLHAIIDALFGACGLPDIGEAFPDNDPKYVGTDSKLLLATAMNMAKQAGFAVNNVDCVIHAERPRLSQYKPAMRDTIADLLEIETDRVSVKAKTAEGLGACGKSEAIASTVAISVKKVS